LKEAPGYKELDSEFRYRVSEIDKEIIEIRKINARLDEQKHVSFLFQWWYFLLAIALSIRITKIAGEIVIARRTKY